MRRNAGVFSVKDWSRYSLFSLQSGFSFKDLNKLLKLIIIGNTPNLTHGAQRCESVIASLRLTQLSFSCPVPMLCIYQMYLHPAVLPWAR